MDLLPEGMLWKILIIDINWFGQREKWRWLADGAASWEHTPFLRSTLGTLSSSLIAYYTLPSCP